MSFLTPHIPVTCLATKILQSWLDSFMLAPMASQSMITRESGAMSHLGLQYSLASLSCTILYKHHERGELNFIPLNDTDHGASQISL